MLLYLVSSSLKSDMKVFYTNSPRGRADFGKYYDTTVKTLQDLGVEVISLEICDHSYLLDKEFINTHSYQEQHYAFIIKGIELSNAVIIDASVNSFSLGHESTLAMIYKKPFLCISNNTNYGDFVKHPRFVGYQYKEEEDLRKMIEKFIADASNKRLSVRFNGYLSPDQKNYLDWISSKRGKNASEIIRDLIEDAKTNDKDYLNELIRYH